MLARRAGLIAMSSSSGARPGLVAGSKVLQSLLKRQQVQRQEQSRQAGVAVRTYSTVPTEADRASVMARYAAKLEEKARSQGFSSVAELKAAFADKIEQVKKSEAVPDAVELPTELDPEESTSTSTKATKTTTTTKTKPTGAKAAPGVPTLDSFIDVDKVKALPADQIGQLWRLRHANDRRSIAAVIPVATWDVMVATGRAHRQFVLPVPVKSVPEGKQSESPGSKDPSSPSAGAELHFLQWTFPDSLRTTILLTQLAEYKLRGEFATPHTTLTVHSDLAQSHGIVLLHGLTGAGADEKSSSSPPVLVEDAQFLLWGVQAFYGPMAKTPGREKRVELLRAFTAGDVGAFSVDALLDEVERVG